jgi:hypothetical protein
MEEIPIVNPSSPEREEHPVTDTRFRASVRGWINKTHQYHTQTPQDMWDERMTATLERDQDIILIPRDWLKDKTESLEQVDLGWWYTVNKAVQEPVKTVGKRAAGKGKQPMTKRMHTQVGKQRESHPRSHKVRYSFSDEERELSDTDDEIQGYLCVSTDPRRSGSPEGGESFILTTEELRLSLQAQCQVEDQTVWLTTVQVGFPTTATEGELDNILDRQLGKPTTRCLHPVISVYILQW